MKFKKLEALLLRFAPTFIATYSILVGRTSSLRIIGPKILDSRQKIFDFPNGVIYCTWHARFFYFSFFGRGTRTITMISASKDGEYITRAINKLRLSAVRGSSSRNGKKALKKLALLICKNRRALMVPDGPRGPKYIAKPGVIKLAQMTKRPIVPVSFSATKGIFLPSWDCFFIPFPFSKIVVTAEEPVFVAPNASEQELQEKLKEVQQKLMHAQETADRICARSPEKETLKKKRPKNKEHTLK